MKDFNLVDNFELSEDELVLIAGGTGDPLPCGLGCGKGCQGCPDDGGSEIIDDETPL